MVEMFFGLIVGNICEYCCASQQVDCRVLTLFLVQHSLAKEFHSKNISRSNHAFYRFFIAFSFYQHYCEFYSIRLVSSYLSSINFILIIYENALLLYAISIFFAHR